MEDPLLEPLISSVGVLYCYGTLGKTQAGGKQTTSDIVNWLTSPFTFALLSFTLAVQACGCNDNNTL